MVKPAATMTIPIFARIGTKEHHIGDAVVEVKYYAGRPKPPTARDIKTAIRKGLR